MKLFARHLPQRESTYPDSVEFGKREKNKILIHTLDREASMYTKTEYLYNYLENTIEYKI